MISPHPDAARDAPDDALADFIERFAVLAEADGLPRTTGRLLALILIEGGPISFGELAARLQVSRGSISTSTRMLEQMGAIERMSRPGERQDFFRITSDPFARMLAGAMDRHARARQIARDVAARHAGLSPEARERLRQLDAFYATLLDAERRAVAYLTEAEPPEV